MRRLTLGITFLLSLIAGCAAADDAASDADDASNGAAHHTAYFAGGCFWCTEADFDKLDGVLDVVSGYMGGDVPNPTYEQIGRGDTGHTEAVRVRYDPERISYEELVAFHWRNIDPTVADQQFCDKGSQYRSGIYYIDARQKAIAEASLPAIKARFGTVHTEIEEASRFYEAEDYHQNYAANNSYRYKFYRFSCGRDARLEELWGDEAGKLPATVD